MMMCKKNKNNVTRVQPLGKSMCRFDEYGSQNWIACGKTQMETL